MKEDPCAIVVIPIFNIQLAFIAEYWKFELVTWFVGLEEMI